MQSADYQRKIDEVQALFKEREALDEKIRIAMGLGSSMSPTKNKRGPNSVHHRASVNHMGETRRVLLHNPAGMEIKDVYVAIKDANPGLVVRRKTVVSSLGNLVANGEAENYAPKSYRPIQKQIMA